MSGINGIGNHYDPGQVYGGSGVQGAEGATKSEGKVDAGQVVVTELRERVSFAMSTPQLDQAFNFTPEERQEYLESVLDKATSATITLGHKSVMLDIYAVLELIRNTAQQLRNAMRKMRTLQNEAIQENIKSQAETQRHAAWCQMIGGAVVGCLQAAASIGGFASQLKSLTAQQEANNQMGVDMADKQLKMAQVGGDSTLAGKQLTNVKTSLGKSGTLTPEMIQEVETKVANVETPVSKKGEALAAAQQELKELQQQQPPDLDKIAHQQEKVDTALNEYCEAAGKGRPQAVTEAAEKLHTAGEKLDAMKTERDALTEEIKQAVDANEPIPKRQELIAKKMVLDTQIRNQEQEVLNASKAVGEALAEAPRFSDVEQPAAHKAMVAKVDEYGKQYQEALTKANNEKRLNGGVSEATQKALDVAGKKYELARAVQVAKSSEMAELEPGAHRGIENALADDLTKRSTAATGSTKTISHERTMAYGLLMQQLSQAAGQLGQQIVNGIAQIIESEATEMRADEQQLEDERDQIKELFQEDQTLIQKAVELFQSVISKETQSLDEIINALKA